MKPVLVDTNVLIDIFTDDPVWCPWSRNQLTLLCQSARLIINPIVYSEITIGYTRIETLEDVLKRLPLTYEEMPRAALFLAGKAFVHYRKSGGAKSAPLPDFFIGAHAAVRDLRLITRDPTRIAAYFPTVELITPTADSPE